MTAIGCDAVRITSDHGLGSAPRSQDGSNKGRSLEPNGAVVRSVSAPLRAVARWVGIGTGMWLIAATGEVGGASGNVCRRTIQVRDAIVAATGAAAIATGRSAL